VKAATHVPTTCIQQPQLDRPAHARVGFRKNINEDMPRTRFLQRSRVDKFEPRRSKQCRIFVSFGIADSLFISISILHSPFSSLSLARCIILAAGSRRQGGRRSQFADTILPAALRAGFLSRSFPFCLLSLLSLSVSVFTFWSRLG